MVPKSEEFILDVRRAAKLEQKPMVATDSQLVDPDMIARAFERAAIWLTPKVVATYDPEVFRSWSEELQTELRTAVEDFRSVAGAVPPDRPATHDQVREGLYAFGRLKAAVQKVILVEWHAKANKLIDDVETWAAESSWITRRERKTLSELLIGDYDLDQLYLHAQGNLYILDPLARFIPGGLGAFDLSIQPSFYITSIYRHLDGVWYIHLDVGQGIHGAKKEPLTRDSFRQAVAELRSLL